MPLYVREGKSEPEVSSAVKAVLAQGGGSIRPHKVEHVHLGTPKAWIIVPLLGTILLFIAASLYARVHRPKTDFMINVNAPDQPDLKKAAGIWGVEHFKSREGWYSLTIVAPDRNIGSDLKFRYVDRNGSIINPDDPYRIRKDSNSTGFYIMKDNQQAVYVAVSGILSNGTIIAKSNPLVYKVVSSGLVSKAPGGSCYTPMRL